MESISCFFVVGDECSTTITSCFHWSHIVLLHYELKKKVGLEVDCMDHIKESDEEN
jgi:hypothetical protein